MKRIALCLVVAACGHSASAPGSGSAGSGSAQSATSADKSPAAIKLTSAGNDPKRVLAYAPGDVARTPCFTQDLDAPIGHEPKDDAIDNSVVLCASWKNTAAHPTTYAFKNTRAWIGGAHIGEGNMAPEEKKVVDGIEGAIVNAPEGVATSDAQGRLNPKQGGIPTEPSAPILLWSFAVPLPAEAVGVGATWHVTDTSPMGHLTELDYTLVAIGDQDVTVTWKGALVGGGAQIPIEGHARVAFTDVLAQEGWETMELALDPTGKTPPAHTRLELSDSKKP